MCKNESKKFLNIVLRMNKMVTMTFKRDVGKYG